MNSLSVHIAGLSGWILGENAAAVQIAGILRLRFRPLIADEKSAQDDKFICNLRKSRKVRQPILNY
jgi:hypothetical protein